VTRWAAARPWLLRALPLAFLVLLAFFGVRYARTIVWQDVARALAETPVHTLFAASALAAISHAIYSSFDLIGRAYTGHRLRAAQVLRTTFTSYAFNLNLGSLVGGIALRLRLYARQGLRYPTIIRVVTLSIVTNWLGYLVLAGGVLLLAPPAPVPPWGVHRAQLQTLGGAMLVLAGAYVAGCLLAGRRRWRFRGAVFKPPAPALMGVQLLLSCANWSVMGALLFILFQGQLAYLTVLAVLLVAAVAGVVTHVPAGLGVLEAVFIALLSHQLPPPALLAALLTYRAVYYIAPLGLAAVLYLLQEARRPPVRRAPG